MPEDIVDKTLEVLGVTTATDLATGGISFQVLFGTYIDNTPEVHSRLPAPTRDGFTGKLIGASEMVLFIKASQIPYKVGSKWRLTVSQNGILNLVEAE